jgi:hypothetical protein
VTTFSWLGLAHHSRGIGTEARLGVLAVAFDRLGAELALSEAFRDNHASQAVSRRIGYRPDGTSRDARGEEVLVSDRLRLDRGAWEARERPPVQVTGLEAAWTMFGLRPPLGARDCSTLTASERRPGCRPGRPVPPPPAA